METLLFEPETKSALITLDQLDRTLKFEDAGGKLPASAPIHHGDLIKKIAQMGTDITGKKIVVGNITVKQQNCKRIAFKGAAEDCPLENYSVERLVVKIGLGGTKHFEGVEDSEGSMAVAVSYNERGIQVGFGHNVKICQNLNIFSDEVFSTYGSGTMRVGFDKGMELLAHWLQNVESIRKNAYSVIERLKGIEVTEDERYRVFGKLYELAVRSNEGDNKADNPLNVTECTRMITKGFNTLTEGKTISAWDLTNWATSVLKPESSDMVNIMVKNARLNSFILGEFSDN